MGLGTEQAYLRRKWGTRYRPGRNKKVGKVMRLNMPNVMREPRNAEDTSDDRCWKVIQHRSSQERSHMMQLLTDLIVHYSLDHDQTPGDHQGLDGIGESVYLVSPGDVGGCHQNAGQPSMAQRRDQLMNCPILQHEAQNEHENPKSVIDHFWRNLLFSCLGPHPSQYHHRKAIDRP